MKIILFLIIIIHGLIHLLGFVKAFELHELEQMEYEIPRHEGIFWMIAFLLFASTGVLFLIQNEYWWLPGMLAILVSQTMIFSYWEQAKYATIINVLILATVILSYGQFNFEQTFSREATELITIEDRPEPKTFSTDNLTTLPVVVQNWLRRSGIEQNQQIQTVHITQKMRLKLKPEDEDWIEANGEQYVQSLTPAFIWKADIEMSPLLKVQAKDTYQLGKGEMIVKVQSLLTMDHLEENKKLDTASLQRYLSEIVLYPSAALENYITWEAIDSTSALAKIKSRGVATEGIFQFNEAGDFVQFSTERYMDPTTDDGPIRWVVKATDYKEMNGWRVPATFNVIWTTPDGPWEWLQLEIEKVAYNL